jgi:hypothetical protein
MARSSTDPPCDAGLPLLPVGSDYCERGRLSFKNIRAGSTVSIIYRNSPILTNERFARIIEAA